MSSIIAKTASGLVRKAQKSTKKVVGQVRRMGGDPRYPYPKKVWTPSGGWWADHADGTMRAAKAVGVAYTFVALPAIMYCNSVSEHYSLWPNPEKLARHGPQFETVIGEPPVLTDPNEE
uniref:Uncharacterized protein n=1 Tax=Lotharella oceanica TaxID=641309 RepID=A0A7S2TR88_9EUKA|mmetsp:Transcript_24467/g.45772  ORF Transcript_24467/g.45772 Transcript_24467/m.45772 type:complete len:119 (+) Transcript_24467:51-407(+)